MPPLPLAAGLALALLLASPPAARAEDPPKPAPPAPLAPFDAEGCKALSDDASRKPAERTAALLGILDARLREWSAVAAGTRTADPARDDRGREVALVVACIVPVLQAAAADGRFKDGPPSLAAGAGERKVEDALALEPWWDLACLLAGVRLDVPADVTALLSKETEGTLLAMTLRAVEGRCPPDALLPVLRLLRHPHAVRGPDGADLFPVRQAAARVLAGLGVSVRYPEKEGSAKMEGGGVSLAPKIVLRGEPPFPVEEDLTVLCRKWLRSDVEAEWRGALAVVRELGTDVLVATLSIEMGAKDLPLAKLEAFSIVLDELDERAAAGGR